MEWWKELRVKLLPVLNGSSPISSLSQESSLNTENVCNNHGVCGLL